MSKVELRRIAALPTRRDRLPPLALVLGSGLGGLADEVEDAIAIPYQEIPGFPVPSVAGHNGRLVVGGLEGRRVALFQGRGHYYERGDAPRWASPSRRSSARRADADPHQRRRRPAYGWPPPSLVAITDHINFSGANPLIGYPTDERFVPMTETYDRGFCEPKAAARESRRRIARGRLHVVLRPELRDAGGNPRGQDSRRRSRRHVDGPRGDPVARFLGLRCVAVSLVTNFAAGLSGGDPSHKETQEFAALGSAAVPPPAAGVHRRARRDGEAPDASAGNHPQQARRRRA